MDWVCEELDEVIAELEEFKEECRSKKELSDSLRKAHNEQVIKFQEAKVQIVKQAQELNVKSEEISQLKQLYEDLKSSFNEKDSLLEHLNFASEKLLADYGGRFQKLEGENKELAMALDEATTRIQALESKICSGNEEVEGLKRLLSNKQKKCFEADHKNCLLDLQKKKVEWSSEIEKLTAVVDSYILKLEGKNEQIQELCKDLEVYNCLLEVQNEETSIVMMILKSEFVAAYSKLFSTKSEMELWNKEREEKILILAEELEMKENALYRVQG